MNNIKFLGICILISAAVLSSAIIWHARSNRYQSVYASGAGQFVTIDTSTGFAKTGFNQPSEAK